MAHRLRGDEGRERRRRETHGITDSGGGGTQNVSLEQASNSENVKVHCGSDVRTINNIMSLL